MQPVPISTVAVDTPHADEESPSTMRATGAQPMFRRPTESVQTSILLEEVPDLSPEGPVCPTSASLTSTPDDDDLWKQGAGSSANKTDNLQEQVELLADGLTPTRVRQQGHPAGGIVNVVNKLRPVLCGGKQRFWEVWDLFKERARVVKRLRQDKELTLVCFIMILATLSLLATWAPFLVHTFRQRPEVCPGYRPGVCPGDGGVKEELTPMAPWTACHRVLALASEYINYLPVKNASVARALQGIGSSILTLQSIVGQREARISGHMVVPESWAPMKSSEVLLNVGEVHDFNSFMMQRVVSARARTLRHCWDWSQAVGLAITGEGVHATVLKFQGYWRNYDNINLDPLFAMVDESELGMAMFEDCHFHAMEMISSTLSHLVTNMQDGNVELMGETSRQASRLVVGLQSTVAALQNHYGAFNARLARWVHEGFRVVRVLDSVANFQEGDDVDDDDATSISAMIRAQSCEVAAQELMSSADEAMEKLARNLAVLGKLQDLLDGMLTGLAAVGHGRWATY